MSNASMKIVRVEVFGLRKPLNAGMTISRGGFTERVHTLVRLWTDTGHSGLGEAVGNAAHARAILEGPLGRIMLGQDPSQIERIRHALMENTVYFERKGSAIAAASALETACWDLFGKALQQPVHALLGGHFHPRLEAYASDLYWEEDPESMGRCANRIQERDFRSIKMHIGKGTPREDARRLKAVRKAVGPDCPLMVDLNAGYDLLAAREAIQRWAEYDLQWIEEPLHPEAIPAMAALRAQSPIPIACGENEFRLHGFRDLFQAGAVDVAMPDIGRAGGIWETRAIGVLADAYGIVLSPHNFSSGVLLAATIQLMASTPNARLLEMDTSGNAIYDDLLVEPLDFQDGHVRVPQTPGLGVHLPQAVLDQYGTSLVTLS